MRSATHRLEATLDHIALGSPEPERLADFYARAFALDITAKADGFWGEAADRRLHFVRGRRNSLGYAAYRVADLGGFEALQARLAAAEWPIAPSPSPRFADGVCVEDPDGNRFVFGCAPAGARAEVSEPVLPGRLQHVVMASRRPDRITAFFQDVLGFVLSDNVVDEGGRVRTSFLRCSDEHHSFAVFEAGEDRLDHHCYEAADWDAIRDWGDHMAGLRIPIVWGPGRHGPGHNLFMFIHDLDGNWVEVSAELERVARDRPAGTWPHEERTLNTWGHGLLRS